MKDNSCRSHSPMYNTRRYLPLPPAATGIHCHCLRGEQRSERVDDLPSQTNLRLKRTKTSKTSPKRG